MKERPTINPFHPLNTNSDLLACIGPIINTIVLTGTVYMSYILGLEVGGLTKGRPGAGREIHERNMERLKDIFRRNDRGRKK